MPPYIPAAVTTPSFPIVNVGTTDSSPGSLLSLGEIVIMAGCYLFGELLSAGPAYS